MSLRILLIILMFVICGCSSYQLQVNEARNYIKNREFDLAAEKLQPLAERKSDDQLVYLLDYGMALHLANRFAESNRIFLKAAQLAEIQDYHSISRIAGSLVLNEGLVQYKGDDYEKLLIHVYLALNYVFLNKLNEALIEIRRLNELLVKYRQEMKKKYEQNTFAHYLSAIIWEADKKWDDAYIDFKKTWDLDPSLSLLKDDLIRSSYKSRRISEYKKWKKKFVSTKESHQNWNDHSYGEVVLVYQQGWGPRKSPRKRNFRFPRLVPSLSLTQRARLKVDKLGSFESQEVYNLEAVSIKTLNDNYTALVAKRVSGIVTKEILADQVRQKNKELGDLALLVMNIADQADLRQWSTLPQTIQIIKIRLPIGEYKVSIEGMDKNGIVTERGWEGKVIQVNAGQKVFLNWRSVL